MDWSKPIIEAVINISTARDQKVLDHIDECLSEIKNVKALHTDIGWDADRTVLTLLGEVKGVFEAVVLLYNIAQRWIDMNKYEGNHPAIGSIDVVPFVPVKNIDASTLKEKVILFSQEISQQYDLPIVFYGDLASQTANKNLSFIRKGGFNQLNDRLANQNLQVDTPTASHNDKMGVSCWTVRNFMIAYNVNIDTSDVDIAKGIAQEIRKERKTNEMLADVKILGWATPNLSCCQISTNIYDLDAATMVDLYLLVTDYAHKYKVRVSGSELIGMAPIKGISKDCTFDNISSKIEALRLDDKGPFEINEKILEFRIGLNSYLF